MTKTYLLLPLLCLLLFSAPALAQDTPPGSRPGTWYAGLKYETIPHRLRFEGYYRPGLLVGRYLSPRLGLQSGLTLVSQEGGMRPPDTYWFPLTGSMPWIHSSAGGYVPLTLRYLFSQPHRRVQAYGLAGLHTSFETYRLSLLQYQDGQLDSQQDGQRQNRLGVGVGAGAGLRVRTVSRLFLNLEMTVNWSVRGRQPLTRPDFLGQPGIGLHYEFR